MTQDELKAILSYNQETGIFTWINSPRRGFNGKQAGYLTYDGYISITVNKKHIMAHRLAWFYIYGIMPKDMIDHINGNKTDNKISNLREATNQQNQRNSKISKRNTSGIKGISWCESRKKWEVTININKKNKKLGYFEDLEFAELLIFEAREKYHKEFANYG